MFRWRHGEVNFKNPNDHVSVWNTGVHPTGFGEFGLDRVCNSGELCSLQIVFKYK